MSSVWVSAAVYFIFTLTISGLSDSTFTFLALKVIFTEDNHFSEDFVLSIFCFQDDLDLLLDSPSSLTVNSTVHGTIKEKPGFNPGEDAAALRKAIEGIGTTEKTLIDILTQRSNAQRQLICKAYQDATGRTLCDDLEGDTRGDLEGILVALITPPAKFDCQEFIGAIKVHNWEPKLFGYQHSSSIFPTVQILYEAGEKKWGTDESKFIDILCHRSVPQLRQTLVEYKSLSGKTLQESIEREMSGRLEDILVAIVKCVKSVPAYLAERLYKSMKGAGTTESTLTRIIVGRSEVDLQDIKAEYKKLFGTSLYSDIESETSGDFRQTLLKICGEDGK
uniref:Annexin n=1 Tax=Sinocyclocheilus rhinocerous TaxID=307959 RepID=A0A673NIZ9_9TELE